MKCEPGFRWDPTLNACIPNEPVVSLPEAQEEVVESQEEVVESREEEVESQDTKTPTDAQVRRMTKPELVSYGLTLGLSLNEDTDSHGDMVNAILSERG